MKIHQTKRFRRFTADKFVKTPGRILIVLLLTLFCMACEEEKDCPICPEPEPVGDYNVYIGLYGGNKGIYVYNTKSMSIVDSILGVPHHNNIEITEDENYLIGSAAGEYGDTWILDLRTRAVVKSLPYRGEIEVSPNGKYIAIDAEPLRVLDAITLEEIFVDSTVITGGHFDRKGDLYYCIKSGNTIERYDIAGDSSLPDISWSDGLSGAVSKVLPTDDSNKVFLFVYYGPEYSRVYAYYIQQDSNKILQIIESQNTDMELTPDGKTLIFTDPFNSYYTASLNVFIADAVNDHVTAIVPPPFIAHPWYLYLINPMEIAITPDGKKCVLGTALTPMQGVISIEQREYFDWFQIDSSGSAAYGMSVACRKR